MQVTAITFKERVLEAAIKRQLSLISDFQERIKELMSNDGNVNEEEYDLQSQAIMHENTSKVNLISNQLSFANEELHRLYRLRNTVNYQNVTAQLGALIQTNRGTFYISSSVEKFLVDGVQIYGLSTQSPLFQSMIGRKAGDTFKFKETKYMIESIE